MTAPLIQLKGIHKEYYLGDVQIPALRGVDLDVVIEEFTAVWGPSGSGKSTLLNIAGLIDTAAKGEVCFDGQDIGSLSDDSISELRNQKIGFIFQGFNLIPVLTALENVMLPLHILQVSTTEAHTRATEVLAEMGLSGHLAHRPDKLSGGQQQRVAIARALVTRPRLVIADEPTANLDSVTARSIIDLMRQINRERRTTFLISTHDQRVLDRVDRKVQLEDGRIVS
jgi:putative ABC transport system ATP-binding protein